MSKPPQTTKTPRTIARTTTMGRPLGACRRHGEEPLAGRRDGDRLPAPWHGPLRPANSSATLVCFPQCGQVKRIDMTRLRRARNREKYVEQFLQEH